MTHNSLEGKILEGNQEKLISKEIFHNVNEAQQGIFYDKKKDAVRTGRVNNVFACFVELTRVFKGK
ncbi:MAG: hypothetical protein ICV53_18740 [Flavisolibacter sp.]|nr:hypothetical protein [Flavisolibacter sp.]